MTMTAVLLREKYSTSTTMEEEAFIESSIVERASASVCLNGGGRTACFWHANDVALKRMETREASCMLHTGDVFKRLGSRDAGQLLF